MNADGSNQHLLLSEDTFNNERPTFAPDGRSIVFSLDLSREFGKSIEWLLTG